MTTNSNTGSRLVVYQEWIDKHNQLRLERICPLEEYRAEHENPLTLHDYLMVHFMEECAELIQATAKGLRFGIHHVWPSKALPNINVMADEFSDVSRLAARLGVQPHASEDKTQKVNDAYALSRELERLAKESPSAEKSE